MMSTRVFGSFRLWGFGSKYPVEFLTDNSRDGNNKCSPAMKAGMNRNSMERFALAPVITSGPCI